MAILLSSILSKVYARYGKSLSNRRILVKIFTSNGYDNVYNNYYKNIFSSFFRSCWSFVYYSIQDCYKEPEELTYLFIAISIGLGIGANQLLITLIAFLVIIGVIVFKHKRSDKKHINTNLQLILHIKNKNNLPVEKVLEIFNLFLNIFFYKD